MEVYRNERERERERDRQTDRERERETERQRERDRERQALEKTIETLSWWIIYLVCLRYLNEVQVRNIGYLKLVSVYIRLHCVVH